MAFIPWNKHLLISRLQSPVHSGFGVGFLLNQEASWREKKKKKTSEEIFQTGEAFNSART